MKTKELFLLRGICGAGKSTLAKSLGGKHVEADMFFEKDGQYIFDATKIKDAHKWSQLLVEHGMKDNEERIVVANTFTQEWEMKPYYELAKKYNYKVFSLIVENRHGGVNSHNVPEEILNKMENRFEIKLK